MLSPNWVRAIILAAASVWILILVVSGERLTWSFARPAGFVASLVVVGVLLFERHLWRRWPIRYAHSRPVLRGTWKALLRTTHESRGSEDIECYLVVRQTYTTAQITTLFDRSQSDSTLCDLTEVGGTWRMSYVFHSQKRVLQTEHNPSQRGAAELLSSGTDEFIWKAITGWSSAHEVVSKRSIIRQSAFRRTRRRRRA